MSKKSFPLSQVYRLLEPGPVVTPAAGPQVLPLLIAECFANLECKIIKRSSKMK